MAGQDTIYEMSGAIGRIESGQKELKEDIRDIKYELLDKGGKGVCNRINSLEHSHEKFLEKQASFDKRRDFMITWRLGMAASILTGVCVGIIILFVKSVAGAK